MGISSALSLTPASWFNAPVGSSALLALASPSTSTHANNLMLWLGLLLAWRALSAKMADACNTVTWVARAGDVLMCATWFNVLHTWCARVGYVWPGSYKARLLGVQTDTSFTRANASLANVSVFSVLCVWCVRMGYACFVMYIFPVQTNLTKHVTPAKMLRASGGRCVGMENVLASNYKTELLFLLSVIVMAWNANLGRCAGMANACRGGFTCLLSLRRLINVQKVGLRMN